MLKSFWNWYENNLKANVAMASFLFLWQLGHLMWLSFNVVLERITGASLINLTPFWEYLVIIADYTEIPALVIVSFVYINEIRKDGYGFKNILYLFFLNSQWLHLFWITDEFVVSRFKIGHETSLSVWLAWVAIGIDYLELPVMYDTAKKAAKIFFVRDKESSLGSDS